MSTTEALTHEFPVTIDPDHGSGVLLVTDLALMVRPSFGERHYKQCPHDTAHIAQIMDLGDYIEGGHAPVWHISTGLNFEEARELMGMGWHTYFDYYCMAKTWIDVEVRYVGAGGEILHTDGYGFTDAQGSGIVFVYTEAFWLSVSGHGNPVSADWAHLLKLAHVIDDESSEAFPFNELEKKLGSGIRSHLGDRVVVVQPSMDAPNGYTARGFEIEMR